MKILVLGGGGREHAIVRCLAQEAQNHQILALPGNAGIAGEAYIVGGISLGDPAAVADFAAANAVDLTIVGPEQPLVDGIVDLFQERGLRIFGPNKKAARLEASKVFTKEFLARNNLPTAAFKVFDSEAAALAHLADVELPVVVKADGLAAGKGVTVATSRDEAETAVRECFSERRFGAAGDRVVIEECLSGFEVSILAFVDGNTIVPMEPAQDYKRVFDGDDGPNTGGMGCYSPVPTFGEELQQTVYQTILRPTVDALIKEGIDYRGVLYTGLMMTPSGPSILEFNVRMGDPETQVVLPRLQSSLADIMAACIDGRLADAQIEWREDRCVNVVIASGGYPGDFPTNIPIAGLDTIGTGGPVNVYHAGTAWAGGTVVTAGGRVLNVSALGKSFKEAREIVYDNIKKIHFEGMHFRTDIALEPATAEAIPVA